MRLRALLIAFLTTGFATTFIITVTPLWARAHLGIAIVIVCADWLITREYEP